ncbi:hypothetical protein ACKWTF_010514 [Chironomus riparius]
MFKFAFVLLLAISASQAQSYWSGCPGILGPTTLTSPVCSGSACTVVQGTTSVFQSTISFTRAHSHLMTRLTVFLGGVGVVIPQTPPHDNGCNALFRDGVQVGCPTIPNVPTRYDLTLTITTGTPVTNNANVRFELLENGVVEVCANIVANIVAA